MDLFGAFDCDRLLFAVYSQLFRTPSAPRSRIGVLNSPLQKLKGGWIQALAAVISGNVWLAYYSRQSLSRSLNKKQRNGTALEWVGSGKDREGKEGGKREAPPRKVRYVKGRDKQFTAASSQRILTRTGQKWDAELLFILALQGTGANSILFATVPFMLAE